MLPQVKHPLQDITDRILPGSKNRRLVRRGVVSSKLRTAKTILSSLPPSSPPPTSSRLPEPNFDDIFTRPSSLPILSSDDEIPVERGDRLDIIEADEAIDTVDPSDPFGFFALEEKLKAQRVVASNQKPEIRYRIDRPIQQTGKPGVGNFTESVFSPRTSSLPSTPSPSKPPAKRTQARARLLVEDEESELVVHKATQEAGARTEDSPSVFKESVNTVKLKRPVRRVAVARNKAPPSADDADQDAPSGAKGRATKIVRKRGTTNRKPRELKVQDKALDYHSEASVKRERERQTRVEYFKKLQDYRLEKENVYVI